MTYILCIYSLHTLHSDVFTLHKKNVLEKNNLKYIINRTYFLYISISELKRKKKQTNKRIQISSDQRRQSYIVRGYTNHKIYCNYITIQIDMVKKKK